MTTHVTPERSEMTCHIGQLHKKVYKQIATINKSLVIQLLCSSHSMIHYYNNHGKRFQIPKYIQHRQPAEGYKMPIDMGLQTGGTFLGHTTLWHWPGWHAACMEQSPERNVACRLRWCTACEHSRQCWHISAAA